MRFQLGKISRTPLFLIFTIFGILIFIFGWVTFINDGNLLESENSDFCPYPQPPEPDLVFVITPELPSIENNYTGSFRLSEIVIRTNQLKLFNKICFSVYFYNFNGLDFTSDSFTRIPSAKAINFCPISLNSYSMFRNKMFLNSYETSYKGYPDILQYGITLNSDAYNIGGPVKFSITLHDKPLIGQYRYYDLKYPFDSLELEIAMSGSVSYEYDGTGEKDTFIKQYKKMAESINSFDPDYYDKLIRNMPDIFYFYNIPMKWDIYEASGNDWMISLSRGNESECLSLQRSTGIKSAEKEGCLLKIKYERPLFTKIYFYSVFATLFFLGYRTSKLPLSSELLQGTIGYLVALFGMKTVAFPYLPPLEGNTVALADVLVYSLLMAHIIVVAIRLIKNYFLEEKSKRLNSKSLENAQIDLNLNQRRRRKFKAYVNQYRSKSRK